MMWNYLVGSLLPGSTIILYDGDPLYPDAYALWDLAERTGMTFLGANAAFVAASIKTGVEPGSTYGLKSLRGFGSTGSALTNDGFDWIYSKVKEDIWLALDQRRDGRLHCVRRRLPDPPGQGGRDAVQVPGRERDGLRRAREGRGRRDGRAGGDPAHDVDAPLPLGGRDRARGTGRATSASSLESGGTETG